MVNLRKYSDFLISKRLIEKQVKEQYKEFQRRFNEENQLKDDLEEIRDIVNITARLCQDKTKNVIESLVTQALQVVFDEEYSFEIESRIVRNKAELFLYVCVGDKRLSLKDELGGGIVDVVAFALRIVIWALTSPQPANVMLLDEVGRFISRDRVELFGEMVKKLSNMLGLQMVIVTHQDELIDIADKGYTVSLKNGISDVKGILDERF